MCVTNTLDRGFSAAYRTAFLDTTDFERERVRVERKFAELVQRAKDAGRLRADFSRSDLSLVLMANSGITAGSTDAAVAAPRRLASLLLHSFRADLADRPLLCRPRPGWTPTTCRGPWRAEM